MPGEGVLRRKGANLGDRGGGDDGDRGSGSEQALDFGQGYGTGANDEARAAVETEEDRQQGHRSLLSPPAREERGRWAGHARRESILRRLRRRADRRRYCERTRRADSLEDRVR